MDIYQPTMNLPEALDCFCEIYIAAFASFGRSEELRETFVIALPIAMLEIAIRRLASAAGDSCRESTDAHAGAVFRKPAVSKIGS
jgi:hypothetical protein